MKIMDYKIKEANTFYKKLRGFMFYKKTNYGLYFSNCNKIHTCFMRFNIDVIGLKDNKVIFIKQNIPPFKIVIIKHKKTSIIEIPHNPSLNIQIGDIILKQ